ncbi:hypothetical protein E4U55_007519 [Claviceps digitariae]|nr:hypothetical protein E4U55_007519 [Claviceps digitariae]
MLIQQKHSTITAKTKVGHPPFHDNLAKQHTPRGPDVDAVAAPAVHVAVDIALDAVGDASVGHGKEAFVGEEGFVGVEGEIKGVAG